jgi:hypothetical protein
MKITTATIADVENALLAFQAAAEQDTKLEGLSAKKLAAAVEALTPKDGLTKDLQQAYTNGEKWWSVRYGKDEAEGCTKENKLVKIKDYILKTDSYTRHFGNAKTKERVEEWLAEKFTVKPEEDGAA